MACPRREVRSSYSARTAYAKRMRPFGRAKRDGSVFLPAISFVFLSALFAKQPSRSACPFGKGPAMVKCATGTFHFIAASGVPKDLSPIRVAGLLFCVWHNRQQAPFRVPAVFIPVFYPRLPDCPAACPHGQISNRGRSSPRSVPAGYISERIPYGDSGASSRKAGRQPPPLY